MIFLPLVWCLEISIQPFPKVTSNQFTAYPIASRINGTRTLLVDPAGDLVTVARGLQQIIAFWEEPAETGLYQSQVIIDASSLRLNLSHGLAYRDNYLYASSDRLVWRWPYTPGSRRRINESSLQEVIYNMGSGGRGGAPLGHFTRTIVFGPDNYTYIGISSLDNVDQDSSRSRVVRFPNSWFLANQSIDFSTGQLWADGLRNPLALDFDLNGTLWELDNGPDNLQRPDLGINLFHNNPPEELNRLDGPKFYGYPFCWTVGNLTAPFPQDPAMYRQYSWPNMNRTDAWCQEVRNNQPPELGILAHSSPIQMKFFRPEDGCETKKNSLPCKFVGDAFATLHGSWNRPIPSGYSVIHIKFENGRPIKYTIIAAVKDYTTKCTTENQKNLGCFRPAGITIKDGYLYVSSAATGEIIRLLYTNPDAPDMGYEVQSSAYFLQPFWLTFILIIIFFQ